MQMWPWIVVLPSLFCPPLEVTIQQPPGFILFPPRFRVEAWITSDPFAGAYHRI